MFILYNLLLTLTAVIWVPVTYLRTLRRKERPNWKERMGDFPFTHDKSRRRIWVHAVSVGEVLAVTTVLRELRVLLPRHEIVLSVTTSSGHRTAERENAKASGLYDHLVYFPLDVARFTLSAMQRVQPDAVAVMETELWFNFLWAAKVFDSRTLLINGRISDRSFPRARLFAVFYRALFRNLDRALMQSPVDADRIRELGAKGPEVFGNCKFDQASSADVDSPGLKSELRLPDGSPVLVVGSTRGEGEERFVIEAIADAATWKDGSLYVIHGPRHIESAPELSEAVKARLGVSAARRSLGETGRYLVLDTYGELGQVYSVADVVVVGGGFGKTGGQNLIQPLALGKPVVHGPNMQNFRSAASSAMAAGATMAAATPAELTSALDLILGDVAKRSAMGQAARKLVEANLGAAGRYAAAIADEALSVRR